MRSLLLICALVSAGLLSGPADARAHYRSDPEFQVDRTERRELRNQRDRDRSAEAARRALMRNGGGRVLSVEPEGRGYRIKVLKDGEVRVHHVDAN